MEVTEKTTPPITNWYASGVDSKTNTDADSRTAQIPPLDTIAPTPLSLAGKSNGLVESARTTLETAKNNDSPRQVLDAHKSARGDLKRAVNLTEAAKSDDAFSRVIAANMAMADSVKQELGELCDEIEKRLGTVRELQMAKQLMQKYAQEGDEVINLDEAKTPEQEKDFALLKRLWTVCQKEGVLLPDSWTAIKREELKRYAGALTDAISNLQDQQRKETLEYKRLSNRASEYWELVIAAVVKQNQLIMSIIRAMRGQ